MARSAPCPRAHRSGLQPIAVEDSDLYRLMREFWADPRGFVEAMISD